MAKRQFCSILAGEGEAVHCRVEQANVAVEAACTAAAAMVSAHVHLFHCLVQQVAYTAALDVAVVPVPNGPQVADPDLEGKCPWDVDRRVTTLAVELVQLAAAAEDGPSGS